VRAWCVDQETRKGFYAKSYTVGRHNVGSDKTGAFWSDPKFKDNFLVLLE
jgi:hypothetical protein